MMKRILQAYIRFMQKIIISVSLFFLYFIGFGVTALFLAVFRRKIFLGLPPRSASFWSPAEGYEESLEQCARES